METWQNQTPQTYNRWTEIVAEQRERWADDIGNAVTWQGRQKGIVFRQCVYIDESLTQGHFNSGAVVRAVSSPLQEKLPKKKTRNDCGDVPRDDR